MSWHMKESVRLENRTSRKSYYEVWIEQNTHWQFRVGIRFGPLGKAAIKEKYSGEMGQDAAVSYMEGKVKDKLSGDYEIADRSAEHQPRKDGSYAHYGKKDKNILGANHVVKIAEDEIPSDSIFADKAEKQYTEKREERARVAKWGSKVSLVESPVAFRITPLTWQPSYKKHKP